MQNNRMELPTLLSLLLSLSLSLSATSLSDDTAALSLFRSHTDTHALLSNWTLTSSTSTACSAAWRGVNCTNNRVTALKLPSLNLRGSIVSLSSLDQLRFLDLSNNRLNGSISAITSCTNLKHIYLSSNDLSGDIPREISSLRRVVRLDLSNNNLRGSIPTEFSSLTRLLTLRLDNNEISGLIPRSLDSIPHLKQLNLSKNLLYGRVSENLLKRFGTESFSGNEALCGATLECSNRTVQSFPTSSNIDNVKKSKPRGLSSGAIVGIVIANAVIVTT